LLLWFSSSYNPNPSKYSCLADTVSSSICNTSFMWDFWNAIISSAQISKIHDDWHVVSQLLYSIARQLCFLLILWWSFHCRQYLGVRWKANW
jgi:hypothetical protein